MFCYVEFFVKNLWFLFEVPLFHLLCLGNCNNRSGQGQTILKSKLSFASNVSDNSQLVMNGYDSEPKEKAWQWCLVSDFWKEFLEIILGFLNFELLAGSQRRVAFYSMLK